MAMTVELLLLPMMDKGVHGIAQVNCDDDDEDDDVEQVMRVIIE